MEDIDFRLEYRKLDNLFYLLMEDILAANNIWGKRADGFSRRVYVRSCFAFLEGIVQLLKKSSLLRNEEVGNILTPEEIILIREEEVFLKESGKYETKKLKLSMLKNFRFAIKVNCKAFDIGFVPDYGGQGWEALKSSVKIRDRITHPKSVEDMIVSFDEMKLLESGMEFVRESTSPLFAQKI